MNVTQRELIRAMAENNLNVAETSRAVFRSRRGVEYILAAIKKETGNDPKTFHGLCRLYNSLEVPQDASRATFATSGGCVYTPRG